MGKLLKNPDITPGVTGVRLPVTTSSVSDAPVDGIIRFNQTNSKVELYYNNQWNQIAKIGTVQIVTDTFTTADNQAQYSPMSYSYSNGQEPNVLVFVGGVQQKPNVNYSFTVGTSSNILTLSPSTSGDAGQPVIVIHHLNSTNAT
jgi:hypothetical protein